MIYFVKVMHKCYKIICKNNTYDNIQTMLYIVHMINIHRVLHKCYSTYDNSQKIMQKCT